MKREKAISRQSSRDLGMAVFLGPQRQKLLFVFSVIVPFRGQSFNLKVAEQVLTVGGLLIFAVVIHKPNTIQTVLPTVIAHTKLATKLLTI